MRLVDHFIVGGSGEAPARKGDIFDPNNGGVQAQVALGTAETLERAVQAALKAQPAWAATNPQRRARVMFRFKELVEANIDALAHILSSEHGKVIADSKGDIQRGLEVVEFACGIPHVLKGEFTQGAGPGIDVYSFRQPIGIGAGITPFNFPGMIPLWMSAIAIATGNAFIIKPSERDPTLPVRLAELFIEAGLPEGICQVVHGDKEMVDAILDHPAIGAISFVGSSDIAHYVYNRGVAAGKRVQAMGGAKNHGVVMPDADLDQVVNDLCGAAFGSAGERCMALPVVVPVGHDTAERLRAKLIPAIHALKVGISTDPEAHYGPVVTQAHKEKVEAWIAKCVEEGGEMVVDGRGFTLQGHENGFFVGPTLIDHVTPDMDSYHNEIFGPVLQIVRAENFEGALDLASKHQYGNGVAIFTRNGHAAREFAARVNVGMVGINVPIPVPVAYHTFGGWKRSAFGDTNQHGMEGVKFWTKVKTVTQRWPDGGVGDLANAFVIPTMG
ncbi:MAG: methylmalonate-semialdehyde dehydrogenase (CoA acylating) [Novosphingobium sp. 28-62-57]|uniref:CoA-acylating methylmalonate-semialdehyde dehydrogenase n=1 Tax=unclassified Novosphingobium TaxID=2644732 RepID=UPI000BD57097|nr:MULTISPECIES: CoA-acylating methylmalonate-semialdehyde dehydrogenase [unclassified Novosphingobium]OYW48705.1 MAG: methylmalonate-semialdehyde dehydrogenase (CoA acylating) [Novosphingobium sp. 12-62-10]OYZ08310.1 MAG: methylmalonate-semialdehyde dehydrogenase (CoA acylating) [Novosphingobium sp. 28-62-57]OZA35869.1 MAG: methylmalonate-semialdehyde dehydrogenase (CoA acylating) [Novosphingobium sp. 17-62-9]HQS69392.1 CoA-acylating methylmalonate-semialdehyde dehydrogenase [Novosphingobium s